MAQRAPHWLLALSALAMLVTTGCGSNDPPTAPDAVNAQQNADDMAQQTGSQLALDSGGAMVAIDAAAAAAGAPSGPLDSQSRTGVAAETTLVVGNVTWTISRTFYDGLGNPQDQYNPITSVRFVQTARGEGSIQTERVNGTFRHSSLWDVDGVNVARDTLTFNGEGNDSAQATVQALWRPATAYFSVTRGLTLADVLVHKNRDLYRWPLAGTATWHVVADRRREGPSGEVVAHFEVTVVVIFDGTQTPRLNVSGGYAYRVDLRTGAVTRVSATS